MRSLANSPSESSPTEPQLRIYSVCRHRFPRAVYLSDGPDRSYTVGRTKLDFEHTALKEAGFKLAESRLLVQALKAFGEGRVTPKVITQIRRQFDLAPRQRIFLDTKTATGWVYAAIQEIAKGRANG
jgi:hypothetical protein